MTRSDFYHSKEWQQFREYAITKKLAEKGEIICASCGKAILNKGDIIAHHKKRLTNENYNDLSIALNLDNIEFLHKECHEMEHGRRLRFGVKGVYLVYGAPLSGKSTIVREQANGDDFIVDFNSIQDCVGIERSRALLSPALQIREFCFSLIERRVGVWRRAFVVGGYPDSNERERLIERLGATPVFIDVSQEECLKRAKNDNEKTWVKKWFETYEATK